MEIACWIVAGLLALAYLAAGAQKATRSQAQLVEAGIVWAGDFPLPAVRSIGAVITHLIRREPKVLPSNVTLLALAAAAAVLGFNVWG